MTSRTSLTPDGGGVELLEVGLRVAGDDVGQRGLAGARRAVEDHAGQPVGLEHPPQQLARPDEMLLADELVERARPHPHGQRLHAVEGGLSLLREQILHGAGGHDTRLQV